MGVVADELFFVEELCGDLVEELMISSIEAYLLDGRVLCTKREHCRNILANFLAVLDLTENVGCLFLYQVLYNYYLALVLEVQSGWALVFCRNVPLVINLPVNAENNGCAKACLVAVQVNAIVVERHLAHIGADGRINCSVVVGG